MLLKVTWFLILISATLATSSSSPYPTTSSSPLSLSPSSAPETTQDVIPKYKSSPIIYTAESARQTSSEKPSAPTRRQINPKHHNNNNNYQPNYYEVDAGIGGSSLLKGPTIANSENNYNNDLAIEEQPTSSGDDEASRVENGFVEPIDFNTFLSDISRRNGKNSGGGASSRDLLYNPFGSESRNNKNNDFSYYFPESNSRDNSFEPSFGSLASSASDQKSRKANDDDNEEGFVDPNVQFRSLFDSTETADGFRPQDFLDYQGDTAGADVSKGSQTKAYPQFTYTGRSSDVEDDIGDDDTDGGSDDDYDSSSRRGGGNNPRYRSSYRQVDSSGGGRGRGSNYRDPYDDSNYYGGERDTSPSAPSPPPQEYRVGSNKSPSGQESSHSPQASSDKSKSDSPGKNKCKKVEKLVDENEEYDTYLEPEEGYDPSTYTGRYKRQTGKKQKSSNNKRPMTCYVCEDEQGRYAERCSYDSKADPKKGSYFHSTSSSFNDNGNNGKRGGRGGGRGGGGDRYKRDPGLETSASGIQASTANQTTDDDDEDSIVELPKKIQKRQSSGGRYAQGYPRSGRQRNNNNNSNRNRPTEFNDEVDEEVENQENQDQAEDDFESPYSPYASDAGRNEYGFGSGNAGGSTGRSTGNGRGGDRGRDEFGGPVSGYEGPDIDYRDNPNRAHRPGNTRRGQQAPAEDEFNFDVPEYGGGNSGGGSSSRRNNNGNRNRGNNSNRDREDAESNDFDLRPGPNYGGSTASPSSSSPGGGNNNRRSGSGRGRGGSGGSEFDFGTPRDFGRDNGQDSQGFDPQDFSIPKEFDPDVQLGASNTNNRPIFSGGSNSNNNNNNNNEEFGPQFDTGYEDYVKQYFPEAFGTGPNGLAGGSSSTQSSGPSYSTSTYRPNNGGNSHSSSRAPPQPQGPVYHHRPRTPERQNTQQNTRYSPPPSYSNSNNRPNNHNNNNNNGFSDDDDFSTYFSPPQDVNPNNEHLVQAISSFNQKSNRPGCQKVQKGDMTCYVCRDPRGMKKEECMYASNDPKNHQMAYHEVSEYSSLPPASILPAPGSGGSGSADSSTAFTHDHFNEEEHHPTIQNYESKKLSSIRSSESKKVEVKTTLPASTTTAKANNITATTDYDFDY